MTTVLLNHDGHPVATPTTPPERIAVEPSPEFAMPHPEHARWLSAPAFRSFIVRSKAWAPETHEHDILTVSLEQPDPVQPDGRTEDHGVIVVVQTDDGFEAGHWGYTVSESDDLVGVAHSLTRLIGPDDTGLPDGIHDPEARDAWYAKRDPAYYGGAS